MNQLTIEHLAPYLPYHVKAKVGLTSIAEVTIKYTDHDHISIYYLLQNPAYKLILRPLSDLTKEITHRGETFVPLNKISIYNNLTLLEDVLTGLVPVIIFNMLVSWHFDVYGLVESGLAIDANSLTENPYEK